MAKLLTITVEVDGAVVSKQTIPISDSEVPLMIKPELPFRFTNTELKAAHMIAQGMTSKVISETLGVSNSQLDNVRLALRKKMSLEGDKSLAQELAKYRLPIVTIT